MKRFAVSRHSPANTEALDHRERNRNGGYDEENSCNCAIVICDYGLRAKHDGQFECSQARDYAREHARGEHADAGSEPGGEG